VDINNLRAFIEVAENKSFSKSAESLKITQPAISKRIAALESELSSRLFDRGGRTVHITEAGRVLLSSALEIISEISRIKHEISCLGEEVRGKLSIGTAEHVCINRLTPIISAYRKVYPNVEIDLHFSEAEETLNNINEGSLDLGLCVDISSDTVRKSDTNLHSREVWSEELLVVSDQKHTLASNENISIKQLAGHPAILPKNQSNVRKSLDQLMAKHQVRATVSTEVNEFPTMRSMSSIGFGWTCLPESELDNSLTILNVADFNLTQSVALVWNTDRSMSCAAQAFVDSLPVQPQRMELPDSANEVQGTVH